MDREEVIGFSFTSVGGRVVPLVIATRSALVHAL